MAQDIQIALTAQLLDQVTKNVNDVRKSVTALSTGFLATAKAVEVATGFVKGMYNALVSLSDAALEQEKAETLLAFAMQETGDATQEAFKNSIAYASQLQKQTGIQDEVIINAQRYLIQLGVQKESLNDLTKAAIDYSVATGTDLQSAISNIGRVVEGGATSLGRFKLGLSENASEAQRTAAVLDFINSRFKDTAKTINDQTFQGSLNKIATGWDNIVESLGNAIIKNEAIRKLLGKVGELMSWLGDIINNYLVPAFIWLSSNVVHFATESISLLVKGLEKLFGLLSNLPDKFGGEFFKNLAKSTGQAAKDIESFGDSIKALPKTQEIKIKPTIEGRSINDVFSDLKKDFESIFKGFSLGSGGAKKLVDNIVDSAGTAIGTAFGSPQAGQAVAEVVKLFAQPAEEFKKQAQEFFNQLPLIIDGFSQNISYFIDVLIQNIPRLIESINKLMPSLVKNLSSLMSQPSFWNSVINALAVGLANPMFWNMVSQSAAIAFVQAVPMIAQAMVDSIVAKIQSLGNFFGGGGGGGGGIVDTVKGWVGLHEGGSVPDLPQFSGDRFPARLNAGETVIDRTLNKKLESFLDGQGGSQVIKLVIGERELASVLLDINRKGYRTA